MIELSFDIRGNLKPYQKIEIDIEAFKTYFLYSFENSFTRQVIMENYEQYLSDFQREVTPDFVQWIDGSFVSNKNNPKDIDFVNLIDFDIYDEKEEIIASKFRLHNAKNVYKRVDAYAVKIYPEGHERAKITEYDLVYWRNWFTETKNNRMKKKFPKGFIELKFGNKK